MRRRGDVDGDPEAVESTSLIGADASSAGASSARRVEYGEPTERKLMSPDDVADALGWGRYQWLVFFAAGASSPDHA